MRGVAYASEVAADAPLVYYPFDELTKSPPVDAEHHQNGELVGHVIQGQPGVSADPTDHSVAVAGSDGYLKVGGSEALQGDHGRTVELWLRTTATTHQTSGSHGQAFLLALADTTNESGAPEQTPGLYLQFGDSDVYIPRQQLADGSWHYVAATLTGNEVTIMIDGRTPAAYVWDGSSYTSLERQPFTLPLTPQTVPQAVLAGNASPDAVSWTTGFDGSIDDLAICGEALPSGRLAAHYVAGRVNQHG